MPHVQSWKGSYRFRRRVPNRLVGVFGKGECVQALGTKNRVEANRLVIPHIDRITARSLEVRPSSSAFARLKRECQILHHERAGGYYGEIGVRQEATIEILDARTSKSSLSGSPLSSKGSRFNLRPATLESGHIDGPI